MAQQCHVVVKVEWCIQVVNSKLMFKKLNYTCRNVQIPIIRTWGTKDVSFLQWKRALTYQSFNFPSLRLKIWARKQAFMLGPRYKIRIWHLAAKEGRDRFVCKMVYEGNMMSIFLDKHELKVRRSVMTACLLRYSRYILLRNNTKHWHLSSDHETKKTTVKNKITKI